MKEESVMRLPEGRKKEEKKKRRRRRKRKKKKKKKGREKSKWPIFTVIIRSNSTGY